MINRNSQYFRELILLGAIVVGFALLISRAAYLQIIDDDRLKNEGAARFFFNEVITPNRGIIWDRNGEVLAISTPVATVWGEPEELLQQQGMWEDLARSLEVDPKQLADKIYDAASLDRHTIYLRRQLLPEQAAVVENLNVPGIRISREYKRFYPNGFAVASVVGFTNVDDVGIEGIELTLDTVLSGAPGLKTVVRDRRGLPVGMASNYKPVVHGNDVHLSLDLRLQQFVYDQLLRAVVENKAVSATAVVMAVESGEILAMATAPGFNPNIEKTEITRNRALTDQFEPGSVIKPFVVMKALMKGVVTPEMIIDTSPGFTRVGGYQVKDIRNFGELSVSDVIRKSSNVGVVKISRLLDAGELPAFYRQLGFSEVTQYLMPGESPGSLPERTEWREVHETTMAYGYGFSVTLMQLLQAYATIANDGLRLPPTILKYGNSAAEPEPALPENAVHQLVPMLENVVTATGTGGRAKLPLYRVAGKSGTVQKLINGAYSENNHIATFVGFAPVSDPQYVCIVTVDDPQGEAYFGGRIAAPVFREIMSVVMRLYNHAPDDLQLAANT